MSNSTRHPECPLRHENGNCLPHGGFCTAVNENVCEAMHQAYDAGKKSSRTPINLNEFIKVRLTDLGKDIYYHRHDMINKFAKREVIKPHYPKEDENGYTTFQLWDFIALYGSHMGIAMPNVIQPLEIIYNGEE